MKLKTKIQLFSTLFMLVIVVLVNASIYFLFYKITTDNEKDALQEQTNTIVETIKDSPDLSKSGLLHAFLPSNGIIRVVSAEGEELIPTIAKNAQYRHLDLIFTTKEIQEIIKSPTGERVAVVSKPIIWEDGQIATLQVANYLLSVEETMNTLFYVLIFASLMIVIPTFIGGNLLSKFVLAPIKELIMTMKANTEPGKWKTIEQNKRSRDEIYEMEETFNDMIDHLKDTFEKQEIFVSDASHELKTPIAIIKSYGQLLKRRGKSYPEVFDEAVDAIDSESDRMQQLVEQMLLLAKNKESAPYEQIDIVLLVKRVIKTFTKAYEREIALTPGAQPIFIEGNIDQIEQVIYILLDNAIKYSEEAIQVRVLKSTHNVKVHVIDSGQGMTAEDTEHVFDRFYRVDKSRARTSGGVGLGLAIAKSITEQHAGALSVSSVLGAGSTFTLEFPLHK